MGLRYAHHPPQAGGREGSLQSPVPPGCRGVGGGRREQPPSPSQEPRAAARISVPD